MNQGAYEWGLAETEVGPHTFSVRAIDFEGNVGAPTTFTWELLGVNVVFTDGPGFTPAAGGPQGDPATGGPTLEHVRRDHVRGERRRRPRSGAASTASIRAATSRASRRSGPARRSPDRPRSRIRSCRATTCSRSSASPRRSAPPPSSSPPSTSGRSSIPSTACRPRHDDRARPGRGRPELDHLRVLGHRRPHAGVPAHLPVPGHERPSATAPPNENDWVECVSPFNLLDVYTLRRSADAAHRAHVLGPGGRHVRARVPRSDAARVRGQRRSDAGVPHLDAGRRHARAAGHHLGRSRGRRHDRARTPSRTPSSRRTTRRRCCCSSSSAPPS